MRREEYETPAIAMVEAINACDGRCVPMSYLRDEFRARLGGELHRRQFTVWLHKIMNVAEVADCVEVVNVSRPGDYVYVWIKVAKPIDLV